jgi:hypothetical protein
MDGPQLKIDAETEAVPSPQWVQLQWISGMLAASAMSAAASSFSSI